MVLAQFVRCRRATGLLLCLAGLLVLSGCWVESINPLYEEGTFDSPHKDADLIFDQKLTGSWTAHDDKCTTTLTITAKDEVYEMESAGQGSECSDDKAHRQARLVKLDSHYFLDVSPTDDAVCDMCVAKHDIFLLKLDEGSLSLTPIDSEWLKGSTAAKTVKLATLTGDTDTLIASSKDLKRFCRKYADDEAVFKTDSSEIFERDPDSAVAHLSQELKAKSQ